MGPFGRPRADPAFALDVGPPIESGDVVILNKAVGHLSVEIAAKRRPMRRSTDTLCDVWLSLPLTKRCQKAFNLQGSWRKLRLCV
jgi:hypothetical protein